MRINRYTITIAAFLSFVIFLILKKIFGNSEAFAPFVVIFILLVLGLGILFLPYFYRKKLEQREPKSLARFIMADPKLREIIKPPPKAGEGNEGDPPSPPEPPA